MTTPADTVTTYFHRAVDPDQEAYFAQFSDTAVVEDESHEHHGLDEIRRWRTSVPPVRYDVLDITTGADDIITARADISGDFPGSPVTLTFRFGLDTQGRIALLTIRA